MTEARGGEGGEGAGDAVIRSRKNKRLGRLRQLGKRRARRREGLFLLEGAKVIDEALRAGLPLREAFYRLGFEERHGAAELVERLRASGLPCHAVLPELFDEAVPTETSQGIAVTAPFAWRDLGDALAGGAGPACLAVACGITDPGNLGTILRTAPYLGVRAVITLEGGADPWAPKVVRAAAGALLRWPPAPAAELPELIARARDAGFTVAALAPRGGVLLAESTMPPRVALLLGAEGAGLAAEAAAAAELTLTIAAAAPEMDSLNVAVAFSIAAHTWWRRWGGPAPEGPRA